VDLVDEVGRTGHARQGRTRVEIVEPTVQLLIALERLAE